MFFYRNASILRIRHVNATFNESDNVYAVKFRDELATQNVLRDFLNVARIFQLQMKFVMSVIVIILKLSRSVFRDRC